MADKEKIAGEILQGMGPGLLSGIGNALNPSSNNAPNPANGPKAPTPSPLTAKPRAFSKGGEVKKTGIALVHKGEVVIPAEAVSLHRALHHLNKGGLHRALGVPEGQPIPKDKLAAAKKSTNPHVVKMANFASTMEGWHHK